MTDYVATLSPVLIVDDQRSIRNLVGTLLRRLGFTDIDMAENGPEALIFLHWRAYGLVISDWDMQPVSGLELLRDVRADGRLTATRFLMMSGHDSPQLASAARRAGAAGFIPKPFTAESLARTLSLMTAEVID